MKIKLLIYSFILSFLALNTNAQNSQLEKADKKYSRYAYIDAIKTYEVVANKGYKSVDMFQKLGNAFYFNAELEKAAKWYAALFAMTTDFEPEYYYRYSQALKSIGEYAKADQMLITFNLKSETDTRGTLYNTQKNYLEEIKANSGRYTISDAGINSKYSDYGSAFFAQKLIFTSSRDTGGFFKRKDKWTNQSFTNMYAADINNDFTLKNVKKFAKSINTKFHEATPVFTKDGKTVYFTRNNYFKGKKRKDDEKITLLKIYKATLVDKKWTDIKELPFNSDQYSVAHPALSMDEKTLYFASDMPGTIGQSDIFMVEIKGNDNYGKPQNLGPMINTEGRETFPFISAKNELFFASDGRPGLGGLDIYLSKISNNGVFRKPKNIGEPANSPKDDFSYLINTETQQGFLTSNREGGKGYDDIYKFQEGRKLDCEQSLSGIITDRETGEILAKTKITLFDSKFVKIKETISDEKGYYEFSKQEDWIECGKTYYARAEKEEYNTNEKKAIAANETGNTDLPIELDKKVKKVTIDDDLAVAFEIKNIYFDLDKSFIRPDAAFELEKILDVLTRYPTMKIDVRSHTDCRATAEYNLALSDRRASSTVDWLVKNGIEPERLTCKGYGETQLVNKCADGVECTEEEHQANRRSQFIITDL
ncbi:MAG: OmpA family protein [Bacteroidota bacterium]